MLTPPLLPPPPPPPLQWGCGEDGQLGLASSPAAPHASALDWAVPTPTPLKLPNGERVASAKTTAPNKALCAGSRNSACVTRAGGLYAWGWNSHDTLGLDTEDEFVTTPRAVEGASEGRTASSSSFSASSSVLARGSGRSGSDSTLLRSFLPPSLPPSLVARSAQRPREGPGVQPSRRRARAPRRLARALRRLRRRRVRVGRERVRPGWRRLRRRRPRRPRVLAPLRSHAVAVRGPWRER